MAERHDNSESVKDLEKEEKHKDAGEDIEASHGEEMKESGGKNVKPLLDEDGDLDITHRYGGQT